MKCFNHPATDAVALCKSCSRALCRECLVEVDKSCACKNRCEADVTALNELTQRACNAYPKISRGTSRSAVFLGMLGAVFAAYGFLVDTAGKRNYFLVILGMLFVGWAISNFVYGWRLRQK